MNKINKEEAIKLSKEGWINTKIAKKYGVSHQAISLVLLKEGIRRKGKKGETITGVEIICDVCCKRHKTTKNRIRNLKTLTCSKECRKILNNQRAMVLEDKRSKICGFCRTEKQPLTRKNRYRFICRECNTTLCKKYRKTKLGKDAYRKSVRNSIAKYPKKQNARQLLNYHVKQGNIEKPEKCPMCNEMKEVEAHHEDYNKPLDVNWLCRQCHADIHNPHIDTKLALV